MPQYLSELITWTAIGARTTESQTHREMASGLSTPVGFKNGTDGTLTVAINALQSVRHPHHFLGITQQGQSAVFHTRGNPYGHIVLRGGGGRTNYDSVSVALCEQELVKAGLPVNIMVDCSHGNSNKDPELQPLVAENCVNQVLEGNRSLVGLMLESHLHAGNQPIPADRPAAALRRVDHRRVHRLAAHLRAVAVAAREAGNQRPLPKGGDTQSGQSSLSVPGREDRANCAESDRSGRFRTTNPRVPLGQPLELLAIR